LRARWQLLPPNLRAQVVEMTRQRFVRDLQGVADLDRFIATGDPQEVAAAVVSMCSYGARILEKRPSRGTGKRRRTPTPSPILPVSVGKHKGGPIPRRDIDWLIRDLALICLEAMGSTPGRGGAFLDLAENVLQIVGIPGAHDRVREFFDRVEQRPRRLRRRSRFRDEKSAP
jgi:hypothetical protein